MQGSRLSRVWTVFAVLLILLTAVPAAFARGSFGGGGRASGGFGGGRSFGGGGRGFGGLFGGSRPAFTPAPRPSFMPAPRPAYVPAPEPFAAPRPALAPSAAPRTSFPSAPSLAPSSGSFGRGGGVGSPASNRFSATTNGGGSFGRTGTAGSRTFSSIGRHQQAAPVAPPVTTQYFGRPYTPAFAHPYYYGGRPANVYFTGGYTDYSFGYYRHPYLGFFPWSPVFFYNPPIYSGGGYVSGGFSFVRFLIGVVFWVAVIAIVLSVIRRVRSQGQF